MDTSYRLQTFCENEGCACRPHTFTTDEPRGFGPHGRSGFNANEAASRRGSSRGRRRCSQQCSGGAAATGGPDDWLRTVIGHIQNIMATKKRPSSISSTSAWSFSKTAPALAWMKRRASSTLGWRSGWTSRSRGCRLQEQTARHKPSSLRSPLVSLCVLRVPARHQHQEVLSTSARVTIARSGLQGPRGSSSAQS